MSAIYVCMYSMYVCMYVCMYICMYVCMYVSLYLFSVCNVCTYYTEDIGGAMQSLFYLITILCNRIHYVSIPIDLFLHVYRWWVQGSWFYYIATCYYRRNWTRRDSLFIIAPAVSTFLTVKNNFTLDFSWDDEDAVFHFYRRNV